MTDQTTLEDVKQAVSRLESEQEVKELRTWITVTHLPEREARPWIEQAQAAQVRAFREAGLLANPEPVAMPATERETGKPPHSQWVEGTAYLAGECATADRGETIWQVLSASPTTEKPGEASTSWIKVWPPEEPADDAAGAEPEGPVPGAAATF